MTPENTNSTGRKPLLKAFRSFLEDSPRNKFLTNATIYILGSLFQKALNFLLIPLYVKHLTPADFGIFGVMLSLQGILSIILGLGIYASVVRFYYDKESDNFKGFITTNLLVMLIWGGVITLLINRLGEPLWSQFTGGQIPFSPYVRLSSWIAYVSAILQIPLDMYRAEQRAKWFVASQLLVFMIRASMIIWFVVFKGMGVYGQLLGQLIAGSLTTVILIGLMLRVYLTQTLGWHYVTECLSFSLPLLPHLLLNWVLSASDRFLLESNISLNELGLYNLASQLGLVVFVLVTSINQAWSPHYFDMMTHPTADVQLKIKKGIKIYMAIIGGICLIGVLFSFELIQWIVPNSYHGAEHYIPLILLAYLFRGGYYFTSGPLFFYKRTNLITLVTVCSGAAGITFNLWAIPRMGALGAALALVLAYFSSFLLAHLFGKKVQRIKLPVSSLLLSFSLICLSVVFVLADTLWFRLNVVMLYAIKLVLLSLYVYVSVIQLKPFKLISLSQPID